MAKKIFVTRMIPLAGINMLRNRGYQVDIFAKDRVMSPRELRNSLRKGGYDAVLSLLTDRIDASVFDAAPSIKLFANYASGFDNIDLAEAAKRGVTVTNAPAGATSEAVAEHTFALMLALAARIVEGDAFMRRGKYKGWAPMNFIGMDIFGKTLGLVGAGRIGEKVAKYSSAFGMKVVYTDVARNERIEKECGATYYASLNELLAVSDVVSLHVPLLDSTRHLINDSCLRMMKPTAFLVNTSRGPILDEEALVKALKSKTIAGAALDVFESEPRLSPGLAKLGNVVMTPHIASASVDARNEMATIAAQNIIDFLEGRVSQNIVTTKNI